MQQSYAMNSISAVYSCSSKKRNRRKKGGVGGDKMLDSVLDESEIQAGCNISLQVSNIKAGSNV
jgi:hypothetical protein